jgi:membrane-bound lytic murein transglycosylase B
MVKLPASLIASLFIAQAAIADDSGFDACILGLQARARAEHLPDWIVDQVLPDLKQQPRVLELDRRQPEFTRTLAAYLNARVTQARIEQGRRLLDEYAPFLHELTVRYGVPGRYLIAFWGLETNFGAYTGRMRTLDSLATLACDQRRSDYFTGELMSALALLDRESLTPDQMLGSWAGAVGHTQFMPSAYSRYAIDGDGDGHINLWKSERDALASGANFLAQLGWQPGQRWGREVLLPADFPYEQTGLTNRKTVSEWRKLGVRLANKSRLPDSTLEAAIIIPAGHAGPAFLVYRNFEVMMGWNRSVYYALAVGLLADRIIGAVDLARPPSTDEAALSRTTIEQIQQRLNALGFEVGEPDGILGPTTRSALRAFQKSNGMIPDGYPDSTTLLALTTGTEAGSATPKQP